jgi:hypothetical protein
MFTKVRTHAFRMVNSDSCQFLGYFIPAGTLVLPNVWYVLRLIQLACTCHCVYF